MKGYLNSWRGCIAVAAMACLPLCAARAANITEARVWAGADHTRLVLDASGPLDYKIVQQGGKVSIDLDHSTLASGFAGPSAQGLFRGLSHDSRKGRLEITADVDPKSHLKSFVLKPHTGSDYRLVLDFYPSGTSTKAAETAKIAVVPAAPTVHLSPSRRVAAEQAAALLHGQRTVVVCIDAGHGGKDSGAIGPGGTEEKNVTLAVARDLARQINKQPGMKAVLTRHSDAFIPLKQRYRIARENNADLFVSIHADSFKSGDAKGSSVWVLSPRGKASMAARWLADSQNRVDLIGGVSLDDKDDALAKVLMDLQQGWAIQASDSIAGNVLKALARLGPTHRGYVEHANFVVLRSPDVPSILVETAFISNPAEERKLRNAGHQKQLAEAVMGGIKNYFVSTPPPGTWFAAQDARRDKVSQASPKSVAKVDSSQSKSLDAYGASLAGTPAGRADDHVQDLHRVNRGESLGSIARQYGVSVGSLKSANRMNSNSVQAGAVLTIPTG